MRGLIITLTQMDACELSNESVSERKRSAKAEMWSATMLEDSNPNARWRAMQELSRLGPARIAQHADAVVARLKDCDIHVRITALETLGKLVPATLAQHVDVIVTKLADLNERVRRAALELLGKLEPATLAQHADAVVARLEDSAWDVRKMALETLGKLEPAAFDAARAMHHEREVEAWRRMRDEL